MLAGRWFAPILRDSARLCVQLFAFNHRVSPAAERGSGLRFVDQALRALKKKLQREGVYREMKLRRHFEKPSEKRAREKAAAVRRARKLERKRAERDGAK